MTSPEQIAKEAAEVFTHVAVDPDGMASLYVGTVCVRGRIDGAGTAGAIADAVTADARALLLAAVERALRECPVPGGLDEQRLAKIRHELAEDERISGPPRELDSWQMHVKELLAHIDHLHRILHSPEGAAAAEAYHQGRRDEREACAEEAERMTDYYGHEAIALAIRKRGG